MGALLTPQEAATFLGWSPSTLYSYSSRRKVRSIKVGRSLRFKREDLERLMVERPATREGAKP